MHQPPSVNPSAPYRHNYVIGDLQGCYAAFTALLAHIQFDPSQDCLWLTGDLVARGENSLATLQQVKNLSDAGCCHVVLGNHDLHLLAVWRGFKKAKPADRTADIFTDAKLADNLLNWLRQQPLLRYITPTGLLCHAGIPPIWTDSDAVGYASEVHSVLQGSLAQLDDFLANMYGTLPDCWQSDLHGNARLRLITNYLTRMRTCSASGQLEFSFTDAPSGAMPKGFDAWFSWPSALRSSDIYCGHWAALDAQSSNPKVHPVDGGCVWGNRLVALRLEDGQLLSTQQGCELPTQAP